MSPYLRSMLEDAADDSGRPTNLDLNAIRAGGRRATWRRRATIGGLAAGVTAVVATVAITVGGTGSTAQLPADQADVRSVLEAAGLNDSAAALVDAIRAAGYDVDLGGSSSSGAGSAAGSGSEGGPTSSVVSSTFGLIREEAQGTLVVADFTAIPLLAGLTSEPESTVDGADGPACAVEPPVTAAAGFRWAPCSKQQVDGGEIWFSEGSGSGVEAIGATLVRGDASGFSVTLATAPSGGWFAYEPLPPTIVSLTALPLTSAELADVIAAMAVTGEPLLADFDVEPALPGETAMPTTAPPTP